MSCPWAWRPIPWTRSLPACLRSHRRARRSFSSSRTSTRPSRSQSAPTYSKPGASPSQGRRHSCSPTRPSRRHTWASPRLDRKPLELVWTSECASSARWFGIHSKTSVRDTHRRIDSHHHFWDPTRAAYPWMVGDALDPVRRPFTPDDLAPELAAQGISGTVLVQTISSEDATREFLGLAER